MALVERTYTFDSFIVGPCNREAYAACMAVLKEPSLRYNPLFLYGETGTGKTHLLRAMSSRLSNLGMEGIFLSGRRVLGDSLPGILRKEDFWPGRRADFLFLDDLQEFLHYPESVRVLLALHESLEPVHSQVVVSSRFPPADLKNGEDRCLIRRLSEGLVVRLAPLTEETRKSMIRNEANKRNCPLEERALSLLGGYPLRNYSQVRMVMMRLNESEGGESKIDEESVTKILYRMVRRGEIDLPEGYSPPRIEGGVRAGGAPPEKSEGSMGAEGKSAPQVARTGSSETPKAKERDYLDELEEKFIHIEREVAKEIEHKRPEGEGGEVNAEGAMESKGGGVSGLIEEWESEEERLIEEE
jgi:hypothetical protein